VPLDAAAAQQRVDEEAAGIGAQLLGELSDFLARFVAFPGDHHRTAAALWTVHTHALDAFESTPRLAVLSPEKGSGKTRLLEVLELLCPRARHASNLSAAALFRLVAGEQITLLFDEVDTIFGPAATQHEELRGLLNAGHRRGAVAYRCVGEPAKMKVEGFPAFAAVALAGIGDLPDTVLDRSILVRMRRRAPEEHVEPFRRRYVAPAASALCDRIAEWAKTVASELEAAEPTMPPGVTDRPADCWEPLLAVADLAGGQWPERARQAALALILERQAADPSLGVRLLGDVFVVFKASGANRLSSAELAERLTELDEAPWGDLRGKTLDTRGLAHRLRRYEIRSHNVRLPDGSQSKGYERADFVDVWRRYLPSSTDQASQASPNGNQPSHIRDRSQAALPLTCDGTDGTIGTDLLDKGTQWDEEAPVKSVPSGSATVPDDFDPYGDVFDLSPDEIDEHMRRQPIDDAPPLAADAFNCEEEFA
jgi:Protein of unknown function (DUF3631)